MTAYGTIPYHDLEAQLEAARAEADRWESAAHTLEEQLASAVYVLAQVCHHRDLITGTLPDDGRAAVAQLIADLGEDELVNLLATLPTGWASTDESSDLCRRCHQYPIFDRADGLCSRCCMELDTDEITAADPAPVLED